MAATYRDRLDLNQEKQGIIISLLESGVLSVDAQSGVVFSCRNPYGANTPLGCENIDGYIVCTLHHEGSRRQFRIHQIVWISQNGRIPRGYVVDHENRIRSDNKIANLRLLSLVENWLHRRSYAGAENPAAKINVATACRIRSCSESGLSYSKLAIKYGVSKSLIAQIIRGELWKI